MEFVTNALYGENLRNMVAVAKKYDKRDCYDVVHQYLYGEQVDKVCLLYGLRRTGKTTLIRQLILNMSEEEFSKTVYIKATQTDTISDINKDLKTANREGFKYIFVDEVTLIEDFIDSASIFSDVYAAIGMKIVLSGTDSLGFYFAINEQLYDRAVMIHTTFIPFREHARLLNIKDVDEYIRYGGTLKAGELRFENEEVNAVEASFRDDESTRRYIDTAICKNIQNSLKCYEEGGHFRHLKKLYEAGELTNAINRIIQDMNHEFTVDIILKEFKSRDLKSASQMLRSAKKEEQRTDTFVTEIKEYLKALDLIEFTEVETTAQLANSIEHVIFTQPGMRYCQAEALVYSLMKSNEFKLLSEREKMLISAKILNDVRGIMLEDIVLLETKKTCKKTEKVFKLQFDAGEFDMVIYNSISNTCEVYEIKHSSRQIQQQFKNLIKDEYISQTEKKYGKITKKCVLYKGETSIVDNGIVYKNVEEYLMER